MLKSTSGLGNLSPLEHTSPLERNRLLNFPQYELAITLDRAESVLGTNYADIMRTVTTMPDTFGLCGVLAIHANGLLANFGRWKDVNYDPKELKKMFDSKMDCGEGLTAWEWFDQRYKNRFLEGPFDYCVTTKQQWRKISCKLNNNDGVDIAIICEYPKHKGAHTHWLAARRQDDSDQLLVVGDLTPFGIHSVGITVPKGIIIESVTRVIGKRPTVTHAAQLAEMSQKEKGRQLIKDKIFLKNVVVRRY